MADKDAVSDRVAADVSRAYGLTRSEAQDAAASSGLRVHWACADGEPVHSLLRADGSQATYADLRAALAHSTPEPSLDVGRLAWAVLAARSSTGQWKGNARAAEPTQWDRIMAKRIAATYNDGAGTSSESNTIPDPARSPASPRGAGRLDSQRD